MSLKRYVEKRDFKKTREPEGGGEAGGRIFVVQLHHASHRHYDFRLELDGVLKSWAVPKGPSLDPATKRLAIEVEDHPIAYAGFEGDIPAGNYGAGRVDIFDSGTWKPDGDARRALREGELKFELRGTHLRGAWVLVRTRGRGAKPQWLLIKHADQYAQDREADDFLDPITDRPRSRVGAPSKRRAKRTPNAALDGPFLPELCQTVAVPPAGSQWLHEVKWDGYRMLASVVEANARVWSRNGNEWTDRVPELADAIETLAFHSAQLDSEMIVLREGRDDFNALQEHLSATTHEPAFLMLFDLLHVDGTDLREVPLLERKARLKAALDAHPHPLLRYSEHQIGGGPALFDQARAAGQEGIISKRVDSPYTGSRSGAWVKAKARNSDEFAVVGFTKPEGHRPGFGALLLARADASGRLHYAGRVGTGFSHADLSLLRKQLDALRIASAPLDTNTMTASDRRVAVWVKPVLIAEVYYQGIGGRGLLRHPAFKALRTDKNIEDLMEKNADETPRGRTPAAAATSEVTITHPDRIVFPEQKITKAQVADYYRNAAEHILPGLVGRPLALLRCPGGVDDSCFFQKYANANWGDAVHAIGGIKERGKEQHVCIEDAVGLLELVQMNAIEFHPWGSARGNPDLADRLVFDLDPGAGVAFEDVIAAAREVRDRLDSIGLGAFVRTSGGKGLHVVVPIVPTPWQAVRDFSRAVAETLARLHPDQLVAVSGEANRKNRVFIDWMRNVRGATSIASYSLRARAAAGVAMPVSWKELGQISAGDSFTLERAQVRLRRRRVDPWADFEIRRRTLPELRA